jgi:hypothetical protein
MNVQELIEYLKSLPADTKVTCCEDQRSSYFGSVPCEVDLTGSRIYYSLAKNSVKIGDF